jgi:hypothetical protein
MTFAFNFVSGRTVFCLRDLNCNGWLDGCYFRFRGRTFLKRF